MSRDFTVAVFVVREHRVLLHWHVRLSRWLPPGGHVESNELPDDAAVREVLEETGVEIRLVSDTLNTASGNGQPVQLARPIGVQLADIGGPEHQHVDLVYLADGLSEGDGRGKWIERNQLDDLELTDEVRSWCLTALGMMGE